MSYNLRDNRGMIRGAISFRGILSVNKIADLMKQKAEESGVPARISIDTVKEGGLFGKSYPCVVIDHPYPPQRYFTDVYIINRNIVNFYYFGESKANTATNKANDRKNTLSGMILNSISGSKEMEYQQEMMWHNQIYDVFEAVIE